VTEDADGARTGTIAFGSAFVKNTLQEVEILFH